MPASRRGTFSTSSSMPDSPLCALSTVLLVMPAAPRSCMPTIQLVSRSSRQASISSFSVKGSPTCTAGRRSSEDSSSSTEAKVAPWMPSRPVAAPTTSTGLPAPDALAGISLPDSISPTHIALTSGLPL